MKKLNKSRPSRIIETPSYVTARKRRQKKLVCDNGQTYTLNELARVLDDTPGAIVQRINKYGWQSPLVMLRKRKRCFRDHRSYDEQQARLAQIPSPTKFDLMFG